MRAPTTNRQWILASALLVVACSTPESRRRAVEAGPVGKNTIAVQPFESAVAIDQCPTSFNGGTLASTVVESLRERGAPAELSTGDTPTEGSLLVSGAITICNQKGQGGEGFSYGAGGKVFEGEREVGEFRAYHFCEYGVWTPSAEGRGDTCMRWVADVIASTIIEGNFEEETAAAIEEEQRAYGIEIAGENQAEVLRRAQSMIITAGPISQQYVIQGPVEFDTIGYVNYGSILRDVLFSSPLERAVRGPTATADVNQAFAGLRFKAAMRYADANAVINATYHVDKNGTVYANGLAVQITGGSVATAPSPRGGDVRLREIKSLRDDGLITEEEVSREAEGHPRGSVGEIAQTDSDPPLLHQGGGRAYEASEIIRLADHLNESIKKRQEQVR